MTAPCFGALAQDRAISCCMIGQERDLLLPTSHVQVWGNLCNLGFLFYLLNLICHNISSCASKQFQARF